MNDNNGKYIVLNGMVRDSSEMTDADFSPGKAAYEVFRIIRGVPLFYEDHIERLRGTLDAIGLKLSAADGRQTAGYESAFSEDNLKENIKKLLSVNEADYCNVKVVISEAGGQLEQLVYISRSRYPTSEEADEGVKTGLLQIERHNPNAKVLNKDYINAVNAKMKEDDYYELILMDSEGRITEGSKSNVFFVKDGSIITAPGEYVLKGITRKYVFEACKRAGHAVIEQFLDAKDLPLVDAAFLSGTSIKVLPVKMIDKYEIQSSANSLIRAVRHEYDVLLEKYIDEHVKLW